MSIKVIQTNNLTAGVLGQVEARRPGSSRYKDGCEVADNAIPVGGAITQSRGFGNPQTYTYRSNVMSPIIGVTNNRYLRNTVATADDVASLPNDLSVGSAGTLRAKIDAALAAYNIAARKTATDNRGLYIGPYVGAPATDFWTSVDTNVYDNNETIKYVLAFPFTGTSGQTEWGFVCTKKTGKNITTVSGNNNVTKDATTDPPTLVLGRGKLSAVKSAELRLVPGSRYGTFVFSTIDIDPIVHTIDRGLLFSPSSNIKIVGKLSMFEGAPNITEYQNTVTNTSPALSTTADTSGLKPSVTGVPDWQNVLVLTWGSLGAGATLDDKVAGKDQPFTTSIADTTLANQFRFNSPRVIVVGKRRIGAATFSSGTGYKRGDRSNIGLGVTGTADGGQYTVVAPSAGTEPYFLKLDGPPEWYEATYRGVVVGTRESEYLLSNEQDSKSVTLTRISSVGCSKSIDDRTALSCLLNGNVLFCAPRGIAVMTFSNERQQYLPSFINTADMGLGIPWSLASSKRDGVVYAMMSEGNILAINPETGGITTISPEKADGYEIYGFDTVQGEPRIVWRSTTVVTSYRMSTFGDTGSDLRVRTSRFGAFTGKNGLIRSVYISVMNTVGGRVRVAAGASQTTEFPWVQIPYTEAQISNGNGGKVPYTGVIKVDLVDNADSPSEGKAIELDFDRSEQVTLISVSVEMKEV